MANIRIDLQSIVNGMNVTFPAPADCSQVTGLIVYYPSDEDGSEIYKIFSFRDAHKNDISNIDSLFVEGAYIKVILDTVNNHAYIQNADTNAYLESKFDEGKAYTDEQIRLVTETGIPKFVIYPYQEVASEANQTVFPIKLATFDINTDTVRVYSGVTRLSPVTDYVVNADATITLTRGVPLGRTIDIEVMKNVPLGPEGSVSGSVISPNSIPNDRLEKECLPLDGSVHMSDSLMISKPSTNGYPSFTLNNETGNCQALLSCGNKNVQLRTKPNDADNFRMLFMATTSVLSKALMFRDCDTSGTQKDYAVFGEHNTELLATQIQSLIEQGVIEVGEKAYTPSSNLLKTLVNTESSINSYSKAKYLAKWVPEHSGEVKVLFSTRSGSSAAYGMCLAITGSDKAQSTGTTQNYTTLLSDAVKCLANFENASIGSTLSASKACFAGVAPTDSSYSNEYLLLSVKKGIPVYFAIYCSDASYATYCNKISIYADEV